ncbi:hypothetical protein BJ878DRAFT_533440 [Calycina marina]|uniref:DUF5672 domain-containing protein n=1 Tax=Calycina marina TaxID=1763456 RepID=A0A9P8CGR9_9HELO|nr:hypothetical protein BJ878DRAFT_533440 [Calycina marina]
MSRANKAAVIIETRFRSNLIPLILHFKTVLGPSWPVLIYTSAESASRFAASASLNRYLHAGSIEIRILPPDVLFTNSDSVNAFMTQKWLWESLTPAEHILVFQSDSMICGNAARSVDDYFDFDLVGAPIATGLGQGYNGGLSLRKRSTIMRILNANNWQEAQLELSKESQVENGASQVEKNVNRFEDQWYYQRMIELQAQEKADGVQLDDEGAINLPSMEIARTFSVETIDYPHPLGVHQVHRWLKKEQHTVSLDEWCPEYKLCSTEHVDDTSAGKSA